jgi:hypothetical protein
MYDASLVSHSRILIANTLEDSMPEDRETERPRRQKADVSYSSNIPNEVLAWVLPSDTPHVIDRATIQPVFSQGVTEGPRKMVCQISDVAFSVPPGMPRFLIKLYSGDSAVSDYTVDPRLVAGGPDAIRLAAEKQIQALLLRAQACLEAAYELEQITSRPLEQEWPTFQSDESGGPGARPLVKDEGEGRWY